MFDDRNTYLSCTQRETEMLVTVFEDSEEDQTVDPATDSDYTLLDRKAQVM